ncbi:hypothetical protein PU629_04655 [Pullulanibacillus sp. KACC 23026]|uniref:hypothetical protein n=1 Tax=Pullulanibacillus sp. KACC 23026 TaxID=3028315 RepID=UPI0023B08B75|nr:hypothetical protein [Pullulanibacillus sp. KACC 23026]WEG13661.1 hypothetical protein PU629_04655 [Pullulanibacillus sp. KACC 23026]
MATKRHKIFNGLIIGLSWSTILFLGKRSLKRYSAASAFIVVFEILNHVYGHKKKWWQFYERRKFFMRDELPFDIGPYMPMSLWILNYSYGNFKKYVLVNALANGGFAFLGLPILKKMKIVRLNRLNYLQFFIYIHYKAYLMYGIQYLIEKMKSHHGVLDK